MRAHDPDSVFGALNRVITGPQEMASDEGVSAVSSASPRRYCDSLLLLLLFICSLVSDSL